MRIGSLFTGYGGLDIGTTAAIPGSTIAWHAEIDKHAAAILEHHWPDIPNHGDITKVDWDTVEPVDILTGGFPCQDVSTAGKRAGIKAGTRSGLWTIMAEAVEHLQPSLVIIENVRGLLSAEASSDVEPCPHCMGDNRGQPVLRALGAVLGDLADIGYDATWGTFRASDVGACHRRERVFIVAHPADTEGPGSQGGGNVRSESRQPAGAARRRSDPPTDADRTRDKRNKNRRTMGQLDKGNADQTRQRQRPREISGHRGPTDATDTSGGGRVRAAQHGDDAADTGRGWGHDPADVGQGGSAESVADSEGHEQRKSAESGQVRPEPRDGATGPNWGPYADAIHRWEQQLGRPAPAPTEPGANGNPRLSPTFVEWMMGLPRGHVTHTGIPRTQQLKALGNGVVPQQATHAIKTLIREAQTWHYRGSDWTPES